MQLIRIACLLLLTFLLWQSALALDDSTQVSDGSILSPRFRSIQLDGATYLLINSVSLSADLDVGELSSAISAAPLGIGCRAGVDYLSINIIETTVHGSPFTDYNFYARLTLPGRRYRIDAYTGYSYRKSSHALASVLEIPADRGAWKIGVDLKWMLISRYLGLIVKYNAMPNERSHTAFGGIGIVIAWE